MSTQLPHEVQILMDAYLHTLEQNLPGFVTGLYLHGSVALGAFDPGLSDIDFLALLSRRAAASDLQSLAAVHQQVAAQFPQPTLEGGYLQWDDLGQAEENMRPYPYYHDGKLHPEKQGELNAVTWWILKNQGVSLLGPAPAELNLAVTGAALRRYTLANLNSYWAGFLTKPLRLLWFLFDAGIQWIVLGVLRQYYTLREEAVVSKLAAGADALQHLPAKWHPLVQEALHIRRRDGRSRYKTRIGRAVDGVRFLRFVIADCNIRYNHR